MPSARPVIRDARPGDGGLLHLVSVATFLAAYDEVVMGADIAEHCAAHFSVGAWEKQLEGAGGVRAGGADPLPHTLLMLHPRTGAPLGYAFASEPDLPVPLLAGDAELKRIYLSPRLHGSGEAAQLLDAAASRARAAGARRLVLGAYEGNARALAFYAKQGFEPIGTRQYRVGAHLYDDRVLARAL